MVRNRKKKTKRRREEEVERRRETKPERYRKAKECRLSSSKGRIKGCTKYQAAQEARERT